MKKVIIAFDGTHFSKSAFEFAKQLNKLEPILLAGVFLPQIEIANLWSYAAASTGAPFIPLIEEGEAEAIEKNIKNFENLCIKNDIEHRIHKDFFDLTLHELKKETRFADLLILSSQKFYENLGENTSYSYLQDALQDTECPVVLVPEEFTFPKNIILAYDGTESSVFAIKQFAYLFPQLCNKRAILVYVHKNTDKDFPDKIQIEELAARHFTNLELLKLNINPKKYFTTWITAQKAPILISGSYGRSGLSELFKKSFIKEIIGEHNLPIFIAHK